MNERAKNESDLDHAVTTEYSFTLKPSEIEGVGVFATHDIVSGTHLRLFMPDEEPRFIDPKLNEHYFVRRFGVHTEEGCYCPKDFGCMSVGWHLNHSSEPNAHHKDYAYYALRDIRSEEEITIDYEML